MGSLMLDPGFLDVSGSSNADGRVFVTFCDDWRDTAWARGLPGVYTLDARAVYRSRDYMAPIVLIRTKENERLTCTRDLRADMY